MISPNASFHPPLLSLPEWNFSFRRVLKSFLNIIRKYSFFFRNRLIDPAKLLLRNVIDIFFRGMILSRCNSCRGN